MLKIIFVYSGNSTDNSNIIVEMQIKSLIKNFQIITFQIKGKGLKGYLNNIPLLFNCIKKYDPQIIHAHYGLCGIIGYLAKQKEQKIITSFMGDDLLGSVSNNSNYSYISKLFVIVNKIMAKFFNDFNIVKSLSMANVLFKSTKFQIIPNGVDFNTFFPIQQREARNVLNLDYKKKIILFAANPSRNEKNFKLAKNAISKILDFELELVTIYEITQKELNLWYNAADLLLLTSFHEGSPNVVKEALVCNCPVVSTNVGDVKDNFGNLNNCFITSFKADDVAKKIHLALEMKGRFESRSQLSSLDSKIIAEKISNIYRKVLN